MKSFPMIIFKGSKNLRATHEDLQKENESLHAQQISFAQEGFDPPCLKCLESDNSTSEEAEVESEEESDSGVASLV